MEKYDKNYFIGIFLLIAMYGGYMYFYPSTPVEEPTPVETKISAKTSAPAAVSPDTTVLKNKFGELSNAMTGISTIKTLENEQLIVRFDTKGGVIKQVELKNHKTYQDFVNKKDQPLTIYKANGENFNLQFPTAKGNLDLKDLYFEATETTENGLKFTASLGEGESISQIYTLPKEGYALDYKIEITDSKGQIQQKPIKLSWTNDLQILENDLTENRKAAQVNFYTKEGDFEDVGFAATGNNSESAEGPISWFSMKQKYFTTGLVTENAQFDNFKVELSTPTEDNTIVKTAKIDAYLPFAASQTLKYYFGPNEMSELKPVAEGFHQNLYLGWDIVKPINRFIFVPVFNWMEKFISNYGLLIIAVVLLLKTVLTPLLYKSYVSSAKMRILSPEINEIKERVGDDQVKVQQETMKLYQQVGVSPLSGCVPMLLQMPILMSVFYLFPNMEMFRQKSFLWAKDLSTFDAPISWGFELPVIGNHISLFVVLMTLSSLAFTYYNNQITPNQPGPIDMKKLSYIFPLVFFFVLNSFPAALSFYYLVSNLVTIAQQLIVKRFVDEDKIRKTLDDNKRNYAVSPKKKNKFSEYLQKQLDAQETMNKQKAEELKKRKKK